MKNLIWVICFSLFILSCTEEEEIEFSSTPSIEFIKISPQHVTALQDEVILTVMYRDGNGDIGENSPDVKNLFVTDSRNQLVYSYRVQQLAPEESTIKIEGELNINLNVLTMVKNDDEEEATFDVYLLDRAGNKSNTITTSAVIISP